MVTVAGREWKGATVSKGYDSGYVGGCIPQTPWKREGAWPRVRFWMGGSMGVWVLAFAGMTGEG